MLAACLIGTGEIRAAESPLEGSSRAPAGHYVSFARERDLLVEVLDYIDRPDSAPSNYHLNAARGIYDALQTPGIKGFWIEMPWQSLEISDGGYDWSVTDNNMQVARRLGLKYIIKVSTRNFDGTDPTPDYFPPSHAVWTDGAKSGFLATLWHSYVYERLIRLYRAIITRYGSDPAFGGIATAETAIGEISGGDYSLAAYRHALVRIVTDTQNAMAGASNGKLFWYLNFIKDGMNRDMSKDARVAMLRDDLAHHSLVIGAPDITPDVAGMPGSVNSYRVHVRSTAPTLPQLCHLQHVDQGHTDRNVKSNEHRIDFLDHVARVREQESSGWYGGPPAVFAFDDLRDELGRKLELHPASVLGQLWKPQELFDFGRRNYGCEYVFWHYRTDVPTGQFDWDDVRQVITDTPSFYRTPPKAPLLR